MGGDRDYSAAGTKRGNSPRDAESTEADERIELAVGWFLFAFNPSSTETPWPIRLQVVGNICVEADEIAQQVQFAVDDYFAACKGERTFGQNAVLGGCAILYESPGDDVPDKVYQAITSLLPRLVSVSGSDPVLRRDTAVDFFAVICDEQDVAQCLNISCLVSASGIEGQLDETKLGEHGETAPGATVGRRHGKTHRVVRPMLPASLPTREPRMQSALSDIEELRNEVRELKQLAKITAERVDTVLSVVDNLMVASDAATSLLANLRGRQLEGFQKLHRIKGRGKDAKRAAEKAVNEYLVGSDATEDAVQALILFLRRKNWGIDLEGVVAKPVWQKNARARHHGGWLQYQYATPDGRRTKSGTLDEFEQMKFVEFSGGARKSVSG